MFLKILYFVIIVFMIFARLKNVCEKNEKYETIGDASNFNVRIRNLLFNKY